MRTGWFADELTLFLFIFLSLYVENVIGVKLDFLTKPHAVGERVVVQNTYIVFGRDTCNNNPHAFVWRVIREVEIQFGRVAGAQTLTRGLRRYLKRVWIEAMALNATHQNVGCHKARTLTTFATFLLGVFRVHY